MNAVHAKYPDFANPELLEKLPLTAKTVLDVGCAQGALGANYLRRNPNCRYLGIDVDEDAAAQARTRLTEVFIGDVEANPNPFGLEEGSVDCIVYGDVLEHLRDPWALLQAQAKLLSPEGTILVCTPNIEHWSVVARLLVGKFQYEENGLFDRTHLRWFSPRTMIEALTGAGLELVDAAPRPNTEMERAEQFATLAAPLLQALGVDVEEYKRRCAPIQVILRARKAAPAWLDIAATMLTPQGGVSDVRVLEPMRALRTESSVLATVMPEAELRPRLNNAPRIAMLHRPLLLGEEGRARVRALLAQDYLVVSEFDDHPMFMEERGVDLSQLLTFRGVHAVQTSTPVLGEALREQNPELAVFPNGVFELPQVRNFQDPEHLTLFFGALNRQRDWAPLVPVLNEVARAVGDRLRFRVLFDEGFFQALETPHKSFEPALVDYATYLRELSAAEISFMPLEDNPFNRAKSDLKFIEAGAARVCALASHTVYAASIQDGKTGVLFRDQAELRAALLRLLAYPEATRRIADNARAYVAQNRMLAYQVQARMEWYRSLWARREDLNAALRARAPELFA